MDESPVAQPTRGTPTTIVARTPRPGRERDFERWLRRITAASARMPGHLGSDIQPPGPEHPDEWVIVYQFGSPDELERWIESPHRAELLAEGEELTLGPARVQRVAMGAGDNPVTAVASFEVLDGQWDAFEADYELLLEAIETFEGFLRAELFPPVEGVQDETVIVFSFRNRNQLDAWLTSDARRRGLARLDEHTGPRQVNVVGGFGGWFSMGPRRVKTWKQAAVVLLALYPTVLALNEVFDRVLPEDTPYLLAVLIGNVAGVAILSWLLMPRLTSWFDRWLRR